MTIEQLIVQCLYENKSVTLQKIGSFKLSTDVVQDDDTDKAAELPEGTIRFEANKNAPEDAVLIDFIVMHTRKMKALAASDLDSYLSLQKQLLNIGNPLSIPGLGTLQKETNGTYTFIQGRSILKRIEKQADFKESAGNELISFKTEAKQKNSNNNIVAIISLIILVLFIAAGVYLFVKYQNRNSKETNAASSDSLNSQIPLNAVAIIKKDTVLPGSTPDSSVYKVVVREYAKAAEAERVAATYRSYGHNIVMMQKDSSYQLAIPIYNNASDTTRILDSLKKLFNFKTYILK